MLRYGSGRSAARLARLLREQEVGGSTPLAPTIFLLILTFSIASCTPVPKFRSGPIEPAFAPELASAGASDSTVLAHRFAPPVHGFSRDRITSRFGPRKSPGRGGSEFHEGIDIKAKPGEEVFAAAAGRIVFSGRQRGYGNVVVIDHGNAVSTRYAHLFYAIVRKGERVSGGERIGRAGKRGAATGTHLHFEIRHNGKALDPLRYLWLDSGGHEGP
jgi:murein DD-endopeptidase MepM/ murein hydrolase activator NlpD